MIVQVLNSFPHHFLTLLMDIATSAFPVEIYEIIVECLSNKMDLGNCGAVCKALVPASRARLFDDLCIAGRYAKRLNDLKNLIISEYCTFLSSVRKVHVLDQYNLLALGETLSILASRASPYLLNFKNRGGFQPQGLAHAQFFVQITALEIYSLYFDSPQSVSLFLASFPRLQTLVMLDPKVSHDEPHALALNKYLLPDLFIQNDRTYTILTALRRTHTLRKLSILMDYHQKEPSAPALTAFIRLSKALEIYSLICWNHGDPHGVCTH